MPAPNKSKFTKTVCALCESRRARRAQADNPERGSEDAPGRVVQTAGGGCYAIVPVLVRALELQ